MTDLQVNALLYVGASVVMDGVGGELCSAMAFERCAVGHLSELSHLAYQETGRKEGGSGIGYRHGIPYSLDRVGKEMWQDIESRQQENQLSRQTQEYAFCRIANALEKRSADNLHADERK